MLLKKINKDKVVSVKVYDHHLKDMYIFHPEQIYKIPFTNIVLSEQPSGWSRDGYRSFFFITGEELKDYIVRNDQLYLKPRVEISMSSGWRDNVVLYFNTKELALEWVESNLEGIPFVDVIF
jgi:hypothetical protein